MTRRRLTSEGVANIGPEQRARGEQGTARVRGHEGGNEWNSFLCLALVGNLKIRARERLAQALIGRSAAAWVATRRMGVTRGNELLARVGLPCLYLEWQRRGGARRSVVNILSPDSPLRVSSPGSGLTTRLKGTRVSENCRATSLYPRA